MKRAGSDFRRSNEGITRWPVHRDGYTDRFYKVEQSDFDALKELPVELHPQAVISGHVADGSGQPLQSTSIQAFRVQKKDGKTMENAGVQTNDLGEYRLSGLDPGTYQLRATFHDGRSGELDPVPSITASAYYSGAEKPGEIAVRAGASITGIDFVLNPARAVTVRGTLRTETGAFNDGATLWIIGQTGEGGHNGNAENGAFEIADVGPGTYAISARTLNKSAPFFGLTNVSVKGSDVDAVEIVMKPVPKIEGEIRIERGSSELKPGSIYFVRKDQIGPMGMEIPKPDEDRRFTMRLIPGEYNVGFDEPIRKRAQGMLLDGKPVTGWNLRIDDSPETKKIVIVLGEESVQ